ncbi:MAG: hypothetical protein H0T13_02700, partial [Actinobacteria bacterium]|nr:hypothetical protein [Actinomycetota bacterium]
FGLGGVSGSFAVSVARNEISSVVRARIAGAGNGGVRSDTGDVTLLADANATIKAEVAAAAVAASVGVVGVSFAGAGAAARNVILTTTEASITGSDVVSARDLSVTAESTGQTIDAFVLAAAAAFSGGVFAGAAAVGASVAENYIGWNPYSTTSSTYTTNSTPSSLTTSQTVRILDGPRAGDVYRYVGATPLAAPDLKAQDYTDETKWQQVGTDAAGSTRAIVDTSRLEVTGKLTILADSGADIDADVAAASVALAGGGVAIALAAAGLYVLNRIGAKTEAAIIGTRGLGIDVGGSAGTAITVTARDVSTIRAYGGSASIAASVGVFGSVAAAIAIAIARNDIRGQVLAHMTGATVDTTSGSTTIQASEQATISAASQAAALSVSGGISVAGGGSSEDVSITTATRAYVSGGTLTLGGALTIDAKDTSSATATVETISAALSVIGFAAAGSFARSVVAPTLEAAIRDGATVGAAGAITVEATEKARSIVVANGNAYGSTFAAAGSVAIATLAADVTASVSGAQIWTTAGAITIRARYNATDAGANDAGVANAASAQAGASSGSLVALSGASATAVDRAVVRAFGGGTLSASGAISLLAVSYAAPKADTDALALAIGGAAGIAVTSSEARVSTQAYVDGSVAQLSTNTAGAASLTVTARSVQHAKADSTALAGGIFAAGNAVSATAVVGLFAARPTTRATLGSGSISVTGDVTLDSILTATAIAAAKGIAVTGGVGAGASLSSATLEPKLEAGVDGGSVTSTAGAITITARYNATTAGANASGVSNPVLATAQTTSGGLLGISGGRSTATDAGIVDTYTASGSTLRAANAITLAARAFVAPAARTSGLTVGGAGVGVTFATAVAKPSIVARLDGNVGTAALAGASSVSVTTIATTSALAETTAVSGGILAAGNASVATSKVEQNGVRPTVEASLGAGTVRASGAITVTAQLTASSTAGSTGLSVSGGIGAGGSVADATLAPKVAAGVGGGTKIAGGAITIQSLLNANTAGTNQGPTHSTYAEAGATAGSGLASFSGAFSDATDASVVDTFVLSGATLNATGAVSVLSAAYGAARAFSHGISVAGAAGVGISDASAISRASVVTRFEGNIGTAAISGAATLDVKTLATQTADAESDAVSGGILAAGNAALANAEVRETGAAPNARAGLGSGTITVGGNIAVVSRLLATATADT